MHHKQKIPMEYKEYLLASVLHDIGVLWKAAGSTESHSELGAAFIRKYFSNCNATAEAIKNHHPSNDYEKEIATADNLSLTTEESEEIKQFFSPLSNYSRR
jgi:HD superfamily phosphodiesterase